MSEIKYSQYGLINKGLMELDEKKGFWNLLLSALTPGKRYKFQITVPNELYFRADELCKDITALRETNKDYTQSELVEHIFEEFLDEVRRNDGNIGSMHTRIKVRRKELPLINENPLIPSKSKTSLFTKLEKEDLLRAEIFLEDLDRLGANHGLDVDKLIEIVYLDFLVEYMNGRRTNVIKEILEYLD